MRGCGKGRERMRGCGKGREKMRGCGKGRERMRRCGKFCTLTLVQGVVGRVPRLPEHQPLPTFPSPAGAWRDTHHKEITISFTFWFAKYQKGRDSLRQTALCLFFN